jgi:hypothetical protein
MTRNKFRGVLAGTAGSALLMFVVLFIWLPPSPPDGCFHISLVRVTDDSVLGYTAIFGITNQSSSALSYLVGSPQIKTNNTWDSVQMPRGGGGKIIPAHQATTFEVAAPSIWYAWRVPVFVGHVPAGLGAFRAQLKTNVRRNWLLLRQGRTPRFFRDPEFAVYASFSPEVSR